MYLKSHIRNINLAQCNGQLLQHVFIFNFMQGGVMSRSSDLAGQLRCMREQVAGTYLHHNTRTKRVEANCSRQINMQTCDLGIFLIQMK